MYKVIGSAQSRTSRVLWMLEELGVEYEHSPAAPRSDEVTELNPAGKIPVLIDAGIALTDSTAIIQYLADKHGALTYPAGTLDRARQDSFTQFAMDELDATLWTAARHSFVLPEAMRLPAIKDSLKWEFDRSQKTLAGRMGDGPFLTGEMMTVPDIIVSMCFRWAKTAKFPVTEPAINDYLERTLGREALKRALAS